MAISYDAKVVLLSLALFLSTFISGFGPYLFKTKKSVMNLISVIGAGMLMSAALVVIIPEGVLALFNSYKEAESLGVVRESHPDHLSLHGVGEEDN